MFNYPLSLLGVLDILNDPYIYIYIYKVLFIPVNLE